MLLKVKMSKHFVLLRNNKGGALTLSGFAGTPATIDTDENNATIGPIIAPQGFIKIGTGTLTLVQTNTSAVTTIKGGTVKLGASAGFDTLNDNSAIIFAGNGTLERVGDPATGGNETVGSLAFNAGDGNVRSTAGGAIASSFTFASLQNPQPGATGNFIVTTGVNGVSNRIAFTTAPPANQLLSPRLFFNGVDFAAYDSGGFVRALNYGADANSSAVNTIGVNSHVKLNASPPAPQNNTQVRTLNLAGGGVSFPLAANQTLTLNTGGLIKSGGGAAGVISNTAGNVTGGLTTGGAAELVVRTATSADTLVIASPILNSSTGGLTKSGPGTLTLGGANAYTGVTTVLDGTLLVNGSIATSSGTALSSDATLGGSGKVGPISGSGILAPGNANPGILTAPSLSATNEMFFPFEFSLANPVYGNAAASGNDVVRLTGTQPFVMRLTAGNVIRIDFLGVALSDGALFTGGFFLDSATATAADISGAAFGATLNGAELTSGLGVEFNALVPVTADFGQGPVEGRVMQVRIVPEPQSALLLAGALVLVGARRPRRAVVLG